ncbi:glycoside hydrolase family 9 protein [Pseudobacteroides cellulosolvens]|uniref:Glucanase n=1 Tax=Pseudobacteroides cellulosolvens ATCC 35603 = DSM 2933 TaxID=398512 RepID=A0A0L6JN98_9FIRM|nr:glycoside hydrolase family 9 protein [Pseudobacteroides cellulosolvens]KNY27286.1 Cellulose 1,4-beta-cellobiosidase [Pseudobacteroides cellulosolvens ATCC 35603 = DSM 2933]
MRKKLTILGLLILLVLAAKTTCFAGNLLEQSDFNNSIALPWTTVPSAPGVASGKIVNNEYLLTITNPGVNKWDVQFRHRGITLQKGHTYQVKFKLRSAVDCKVYAKIGDQGEPYKEYWSNDSTPIELIGGEEKLIDQTFVMASDTIDGVELAFQFGGEMASEIYPYTVAIDDVYLLDEQFTPTIPPELAPAPDVRVNQVGYFPNGQKKATLVSDSTTPVKWYLRDKENVVVASGNTQVVGLDAASGDKVHIIDFSSYKLPGTEYKITVGKSTSHPFDIATNLYSVMKYDAMRYFYHSRSGIKIEMPYCAQPQWARAAGHAPDVGIALPQTGEYTLDVTGGWYDAGDHGKYVVNGGISVWTLMNLYERAKKVGGVAAQAFRDGKLIIPENTKSSSIYVNEKYNGTPDILDECKWELDFLLKMQIPEGYPNAGMALHKINDKKWTMLGLAPADDKEERNLYPASTAATLNLAATAAQGSRLWKIIDSKYSEKLLAAAELAWDKAMENPAMYAQSLGGGGGDYGDSNVKDDFYWAACELYVTTGSSEYLDYIQGPECSEYYLKMPSRFGNITGCFDWGTTNGLGTLTLAMAPNKLPQADIDTAKKNIIAAADSFMAVQAKEGYGAPLEPSYYTWGSNSFILNECVVMGVAYDFTKDSKYINGVTESFDYLLGRNPNDKSYISGYGEKPLRNPHHRFFANQANKNFPTVPPGFVSGGPNSGCEDPYIQEAGIKGKPPQKCFIDHIESWSSNEITINWNAPLVWVTEFLDEVGGSITESVKEDINKDKAVNMMDVAMMAKAFGGVAGDTLYDSKCDLDGDGSINMNDVVILAKKFGFTY